MGLEMTLGIILAMGVLAFFCEYMDSTLGMGYGTTLTPILLIMGYEPLQVVPVVLISELFSGLLAGALHHKEGNVDFRPKMIDMPEIISELKSFGYIKTAKKVFPKHLKVALILAMCSIVGTISAVFIAVSLPKFWIKLYIGILVISMGIIILICFNKTFRFSWNKIIGLGLLASFNKGISGGGYGPVVTSGQILSGVEGKSAVGITSLAEGLTCAVGIATYFIVSGNNLNLQLVTCITAGAILSVPFSVKSVKKITEKRLKLAIAVLTIILGVLTLWKLIAG
ncbi:MAG: sulfite exporter TauE/SafE family protein [Candidatus Omnitrophica bacterium]|nr:sulfite exporter TauE/SafE family protein [Candidatus Omnitrophota bacterium]